MSRKNMRILVLGDENVGKSSLIHTIYSQVSSNVQKTLKKVILPPQMCLYSKQVFTELVDTSVDMDLTADIRSSDLVLLVYDVSDPQTVARIDNDWLPRICAINPKIPVILVGNKIDKKQLEFQSEHQYIKIKDILKKSIKKYKNVQMGIQCSAFYDRNVKSVLNCAQRAVLYPLSPLYNLQEKKITQGFRKALIRIFRILDEDFDGRLHDSEITTLQQRVFQSQLHIQDIKIIKQIILRQLQVQQHDYIQLKGFIALQKKVIQMLKIQICWSIVRHFHYDDNLRLKINTDHYSVNENIGQSLQLSSQSINFLMRIYDLGKRGSFTIDNKVEQSQEKLQNKTIMQIIFQPCPELDFEQFSNLKNVMSEQKFLTAWNLYAFMNYKNCYRDLLYLGLDQSLEQTFNRRKNKKIYNQYLKFKDNKVFSILIIQSPEYEDYIEQLFIDGTKVSYSDKQGKQYFNYTRNSKIFANQSASKTFLLFKIKRSEVKAFFKSDASFAKRIDLVIQFQGQQRQSQNIILRGIIPNYMLYRKITTQEAVNILHANQPMKLDLNSFPIKYQQKSYVPFLNDVIFKTFSNIEEGLTKQTLQQLKQQSKHKKNVMLLSGFTVAVTAIIIGSIVMQKYKIKFWK